MGRFVGDRWVLRSACLHLLALWLVHPLLLAQPAPPGLPEPDSTWGDAVSAPQALPVQAKLRWLVEPPPVQGSGPLALARTMQPGWVAAPSARASATLELRSEAAHWTAAASVQLGSMDEAGLHAWLDELALHTQQGDWSLSAGRRVLAWDVGYAFRPNDVVQREQRRSLVSSPLQGRAVLMAEHFGVDSAWSLVWAHPGHARSDRDVDEPALAARLYLHRGALDWHGFARVGAHTHASAGVALAWVADDALELHASLRLLRGADVWRRDPGAPAVASQNPWRWQDAGRTGQALLGGTWTHASQFSVLAELWWDGTAQSKAQWQAWQRRQQLLAHGLPMLPVAALAGNLAWQAQDLSGNTSLHQRNAFVRLSWVHDAWQPSLDLLYHPADGGQLWTLALQHTSARAQWQFSLRWLGGSHDAVLRQLPSRNQAALGLTLAF